MHGEPLVIPDSPSDQPPLGVLLFFTEDFGNSGYLKQASLHADVAKEHNLVLASMASPAAPGALGVDTERLFTTGLSGGSDFAAAFHLHTDYRYGGGVVALCGGDIPLRERLGRPRRVCRGNGLRRFLIRDAGLVPVGVDPDAHDAAIDAILAAPAVTHAALAPDLRGNLRNPCREMAERGLFAFDSSPLGGRYRKVAAPSRPVLLAELPRSAAAVAVPLEGVRFGDADVIVPTET